MGDTLSASFFKAKTSFSLSLTPQSGSAGAADRRRRPVGLANPIGFELSSLCCASFSMKLLIYIVFRKIRPNLALFGTLIIYF
jgi:hypothetical protein